MSTTLTATYEGGVLRPLTPLSLPEHAASQVKIVKSPDKKDMATDRRQACLRRTAGRRLG